MMMPPTPLDPVVDTLRLMGRHGVEMRQVPGMKPGFTLPVPATMPPSAWWGIVTLAVDKDFPKVGRFNDDDQRRIDAEHAHWRRLDGAAADEQSGGRS